MSDCNKHEGHNHQHGAGCGHTAVHHEGHVDYLHDGHLHHVHGDHVDEHVLEVTAQNPDVCTPDCGGHDQGNRVLNTRKTGDKLFKGSFVPAAELAFDAKASFQGSVSLQHIQC